MLQNVALEFLSFYIRLAKIKNRYDRRKMLESIQTLTLNIQILTMRPDAQRRTARRDQFDGWRWSSAFDSQPDFENALHGSGHSPPPRPDFQYCPF